MNNSAKQKNRTRYVLMFFVAAMFIVTVSPCFAFTTPASGDLFYDAYTIVVTRMLQGPLGFVVAIFLFAVGLACFIGQKILAGVLSMACTGLLIKADSIISSLGMLQ